MKENKGARAIRIQTLIRDYFQGCIEKPFRRQSFRLEAKDWKEILLAHQDRMLHNGEYYQIIGNSLGFGVVELHLEDWEV